MIEERFMVGKKKTKQILSTHKVSVHYYCYYYEPQNAVKNLISFFLKPSLFLWSLLRKTKQAWN